MRRSKQIQTAEEEDEFYASTKIEELTDNDELTIGEEGFMSGYINANA